MIELFLLAQSQTASGYSFLTQANKTRVEQLVYNSPRDRHSKPIVSSSDISNILQIYPQCGKRPDNPQITCTWKEGKREIKAYFFSRNGQGMEFQRWEALGFGNNHN